MIFIFYANKYINTGLLIIPNEFIIDQNNVLEMNDEVKSWVNEECECDPSFKLSKYEIESWTIFKRLGFKRINDGFKFLGCKYVKDARKIIKKESGSV